MKTFKHLPIHPLFWGLFPSLVLLGNNITHIAAVNAIRAILVSLVLTGILLGALRLALRTWTKASIAVTGFLVLFFSYGHIYDLVQNRLIFGMNVGRHRVVFPLFILAFALILFWVVRIKDTTNVTYALNLIGVLVLIYPLFQIGSFEIRVSMKTIASPVQAVQTQVSQLAVAPGENPPDIYYIILDTYTRADTLQDYFAYDNSSFIGELKSRGFYVGGCSQSNYSYTALSLASSLNFNYPDTFAPSLSAADKNVSDIYPYLSSNAVAYELRKLGYRFEAIDSGYSPTELKNADVYYSPEGYWQRVILEDGINSYEAMLVNSSAGMLFYEFNAYLPQNIRNFMSAYVLHRERMLYALSMLDNMASKPGPKFVFVHLLAPHNPFVFGPNGEYLERKTPFTLNDDREVVTMKEYVSGYRDQVTYLNQRMLAIVDTLIKESARPPIIIIQGDHGTARIPGWNDTILNAYYFPGKNGAGLYPGISPVNTFRVIFNDYFGGQLPILFDHACTMNGDEDPFSCVQVTEPNPLCGAASSNQTP